MPSIFDALFSQGQGENSLSALARLGFLNAPEGQRFGPRTPVTGNPDDEATFRRNMGLPPISGTAAPSFNQGQLDPIAPWLGTEGPRSLTGPPRGSPAGGLPIQAQDAPNLMLTRERIQRELEDNPRLRQAFDQNTTAEVGTNPENRRAYQASAMDRAVQTGAPLANVVNNPNYYPETTTRATATTGQGVDPSLFEGANPVNFGTGNASYNPKTGKYVAFAGGPLTANVGGENYGIEGQGGLPYARAVGYTGPGQPPTQAQLRQGAVPPSTVALQGGPPNAEGDLEVGAQRRLPVSPGQSAGAAPPVPALQAAGPPPGVGDRLGAGLQGFLQVGAH